jgi:hypothetical protein
MPATFAGCVLRFFKLLKAPAALPKGIEVLNPYQDPATFRLCQKFYTQYYNDALDRQFIIGINPGRLGGGLTGIPFTDPVQLEHRCGIQNTLPKIRELSSTFIYEVIEACGGPSTFYRKYYFTSVSPLGFTREEKNMNYYDDRMLKEKLRPFIINSLKQQITFGINRKKAFCLGEGENYKFLSALNDEWGFFDEIVVLPHPRFVMQYKRKQKDAYVARYRAALTP